MQDALIQLVVTILAAIATGAITIGIAFLQSKLKSGQLTDALGRLQVVTESVIAQQQVEFVEKWKELSADGKLTKDEIGELAALTRDNVIVALDKPAANVLTAAGADIDALIRGFTEQAVQKIRGNGIEYAELITE